MRKRKSPKRTRPGPAKGTAGTAIATPDALTGLFDSRHLDRVLPALLEPALREQEPLAVAMIDLDHIQAINDRHGRDAGDALLKSFGELLSKQARTGDVACRSGGEEFCLLLPRTDAHTARRRVNALLSWWRDAEFRFDTGLSKGHAFSAGIADSFLAPGAPADLLGAAQACLAEAKRLGCNRVLVFDAEAAGQEGAD